MHEIVSRYRHAGTEVYLLAEAATQYIGEHRDSGLHTTHWENMQVIRETRFVDEMTLSLAVEGQGVVTCAGMGATIDIMLNLVGQLATPGIRTSVADIFLHEKVRDPETAQPFSGTNASGSGDKIVDKAIHLMQTKIEDPVSIGEIAARIGVSCRLLERRFGLALNTTPYNHYRRLRLSAAKNLLLNTDLKVLEIGIACGFQSGFASVFKEQYGVTPVRMRRRRREIHSPGRFLEIL